eukprot:TRINITY_DN1763_c0_g2_i1.p1 TRINITY_DN1763_c0_g2~~TRINITY_DN1763_c0_g2_i1.p1  ORF type:complete len:589 (-),score=54.92 TRINITY_DN1763_c0_g2_i1:1901-3613(-)
MSKPTSNGSHFEEQDDPSLKCFKLVAKKGLTCRSLLCPYDLAELSRVSHAACEWLIPRLSLAAPRDTDKKTLGLLAWQHKNITKLDLTKTEQDIEKQGLKAMCRLAMFPELTEVEIPDAAGTGMLEIMREIKPTLQKVNVIVNKVISTNQAYMDQFVQMSSTMNSYWKGLRVSYVYIRKQDEFSELMSKIQESKTNGVPIMADLVLDVPMQSESIAKDNQTIKYVISLANSNEQFGRTVIMMKTMVANRVRIFSFNSAKNSWVQSLKESNKKKQYYSGTYNYDITCSKWWHRSLAQQQNLSQFLLCWQFHLNYDHFERKEDPKNIDSEIEVVHSQLSDHVDQLKLQFSGTNVSAEDMILGKILDGFIDSRSLSVLHISINSPQVLSALIDSEQYQIIGDLIQLQRLCISLNILDKDYKRDGIIEEFLSGFIPQLPTLASFGLFGIVGGDDYVFFDVSILSQLRDLKSLEIQVENLLIDYGHTLESVRNLFYLTRIELEVGFDFESVPLDVLPAISSNHLEEMEDDLMELLPQLRVAKVHIEESVYDDLIEYQRQNAQETGEGEETEEERD